MARREKLLTNFSGFQRRLIRWRIQQAILKIDPHAWFECCRRANALKWE